MSNEGGAEMARRRHRSSTSPAAGPLEDNDLLAEILLRLPAKPSSLPRASVVCKRWRSIATAAAFRRRFRIHHRKPPILGVFEHYAAELVFTSVLEPPDRIPSGRFSLDLPIDRLSAWNVLGCRHGRVLLMDWMQNLLLVFEPVSGDKHRIPIPPEFTSANAAVLCAAGGDQDHVHGDCHMSPFKVVLVGARSPGPGRAIARVYSQETGMWKWGDLVSTAEPCAGFLGHQHSTLVGGALYWCLDATTKTAKGGILKFDLDNQSLTVISRPPAGPVGSEIKIIRAEDGGLGLAVLSYPSLQLWDRMVDCHGVATWVPRKTVDVDEMLGFKAKSVDIEAYVEEADGILMSAYKASEINPFRRGLFIVQLESMMVKEWHGDFCANSYHPLTNFYTAGTARVRSTPPAIRPARDRSTEAECSNPTSPYISISQTLYFLMICILRRQLGITVKENLCTLSIGPLLY